MRLGDLDQLKVHISELILVYSGTELDNAILNAIDNAPTVPLPDFKEGYKQAIIDGKTNFSRPQGKWINPADCLCYQCSNCGEYTNNEGTVAEGLFDYCPKCGADMRGKEE